MRNKLAIPLALVNFLSAATSYKVALPNYRYEFPRDHFNHPDFQTEWWYYTGNLRTAEGRRFGFELTFFRAAIDRPAKPSVWDVTDVWMAHLALSDIDGNRFFHTERLNRRGAGIAGADERQAKVWNGNWQAKWNGNTQALTAIDDKFNFDLNLRTEKPPVIHGKTGVSQKAEGAGNASHYISFTRLITSGSVTLEGKAFSVSGVSWMDHEFFTEKLLSDIAGWDWFSLQFDDNTEVMLYRLRRKDGTAARFSAGTYVDRQGRATPLSVADFAAIPVREWISPETGTHYPIAWTLKIPSLGIDVSISTRLPQQELASKIPVNPSYWEGAIEIMGTKKGVGYLEMTRALQR
jgi:predicted secreted hydrolase